MSATMLSDQLVVAPSIGQTIDPVNGYQRCGARQTTTSVEERRDCVRVARNDERKARAHGEEAHRAPRHPQHRRLDGARRVNDHRGYLRQRGQNRRLPKRDREPFALAIQERFKHSSALQVCDALPERSAWRRRIIGTENIDVDHE